MNEPAAAGKLNFRFECQPGCTNCCTRRGHVHLTEEDIDRIAVWLGFERPEFENRYVHRTRDGARLTLPRADSCHFLISGGCGIHEVKPLQCRVFPFWPEHVGNRSAWNALRRHCPGIGVGPLVRIEKVRAEAQEYRRAFPDL